MISSTQGRNYAVAVRPRRFIEATSLPFLLRLRLYDPAHKPRGLGRLRRKLGQAADEIVHGWLGVPATGRFTVRLAEGAARQFPFEARQSAYLAFISRNMHGGYEATETLFLEAMLARAACFYDVGANWGYYTLLAATHPGFPGRVCAFEISDRMNAALARMVETLRLDRVDVVGCGLSDVSGPVTITADNATHLTRVVAGPGKGGKGARTVVGRALRLDDVDLPPPDLMKIDVEDHEINVLRGGQRMLDRHRPLILFESRHGGDGGEAGRFLRALGYGLYRLHERTGSDSTIGLSPVAPGSPPGGLANLVAVPAGQEARWLA